MFNNWNNTWSKTPLRRNIMTCKLMKELMEIEGIKNLSHSSIEKIKRIICGTHNGICSEKYSGIKEELPKSCSKCRYEGPLPLDKDGNHFTICTALLLIY
jgi:hypothetical protein